MSFKRAGHSDDLLFLIALLVPAVFAYARYFESDRQMEQIARARSQSALVAVNARHPQAHPGVAYAQSQGR